MTKSAENGLRENRPRTPKPRPSFEVFISELGSIQLSDSPSYERNIQAIMSILRKGFQEPIEGWHISEIVKHVSNWNGLSALGVRLAYTISIKRNELLDSVTIQVRKILARIIGYPEDLLFISLGLDSSHMLTSWMNEVDLKSWADWDFCRSFFACILKPGAIAQEILLCVRALTFNPKLHFDEAPRESKLIKNALMKLRPWVIGKKHPGPRVIILELIHLLSKLESNKAELNYESQEEKMTNLYETLSAVRKKTDRIENEYEEEKTRAYNLEKENIELKSEIEKFESLITEENKKFIDLDKHWEKESVNRVLKELDKLKHRVFHEAREADYALDSNNSDILMALSRIRQIEELTKIEER